MSYSRTPSRSRSSLGNYPNSNSPAISSSTLAASQNQTPKTRVSVTDLRRPPSSRSNRPASPRMSFAGGPSSSLNRSRSSSSMGMRSRPTTPSFIKPDPYTGSISVSIRPNPYSVDYQNRSSWFIDEPSNTIINNEDTSEFTFDNVFRPDTSVTNRHVYNKACAPLVHKFLHEGYNSTVFAYGMTGSGKTFSMRGRDQDPGFVKLAIDEIFDRIENDVSSKKFTVSITYLEIYNEKIIDLLNSGPPISSDLKIRDDPVYGNKIIGITNPVIKSRDQILQYIKRGDNNRKTSETDYNARSSRSHAILQIKLNTVDLTSGMETNATLSLCDLAGSERGTSSSERRKEGSFINKSLLALSTVINKLSISSNTGNLTDHVPYRDSKLTRLLQPALSGSSLVSILCTIHMGSSGMSSKFVDNQFVAETYNTLRFAARAKDVVINVQKNKSTLIGEGDSARLVEELRRTVEIQSNEIFMLRNSDNPNAMQVDDQPSNHRTTELEIENKVLYEKLEHLTRLTDLQKTETVILKNDSLNDLLGSDLDNNSSQIMIANVEEFYKRVNHEIDEYRAYIRHLEQRLKSAYQETASNQEPKRFHGLSERQLDALLKEQEEEIMHLKEVVKDKDHFIKSLTKTSKLRRLVDSDFVNTPEKSKNSHIDKENNEVREYSIDRKNGESMNFVV
ncbi:hypothetical protein CANTEDRAFT_125333 [Yamadazyma tenuis ATCC 10573]|uniref:Kinesin-like protein n=1 Tax=Candida tenuis (strain ATCC 10573 / BCRC 21748 / CBS 615 / JCM 9827 / NBRC 10315 / NRRL Y-1498 / VKM Y-70) TaxID=590646 RepID=G3B9R4_CANTC|nr:uncharacterized protein CANTEDRAFT_125333 [Yamadazyma tenuis ATCC 10573]EGV61951.1 hypothetical protein CANTEDRAFT_125333 [Yamadazyma tenuis ATCC 10573]